MQRAKVALIITAIVDAALWALPYMPADRHWSPLDVATDVNAAPGLAIIVAIGVASLQRRSRSDKRVAAMAAEYEQQFRDLRAEFRRDQAALIKMFADQLPRNPTGPLAKLYEVPGPRR